MVIVQSQYQKDLLKQDYRRDGLIIKNAFPQTSPDSITKADPPIVLWVATIREVKQPRLFLELADLMPGVRFQMIGGLGTDQSINQMVKRHAARSDNLEYVGFVPFDEIDDYYKKASILVNTSKYEGFSNAFIQAWMNITPVISLHSDPDEIICKYNLGRHSKTFNQLLEDVKTLLADNPLLKRMGENGRRYVETEHQMEKVADQFVKVFRQLI